MKLKLDNLPKPKGTQMEPWFQSIHLEIGGRHSLYPQVKDKLWRLQVDTGAWVDPGKIQAHRMAKTF